LTTRFWTSTTRSALAIGLALVAAGCAATNAFKHGEEAAKAGDLDQAVAYYRTASQAEPNNANYQIALQRSMQASSRAHFTKAQEYEKQAQLQAARGEYALASEYDPSNRIAIAKIAELDRTLRQQAEAARPRPFAEMQAQARARALANAPALINAGSKEPLGITINSARPADAINAVANAGGISVTFDNDVNSSVGNRTVTLQADLTFEQALNQIMLQSSLAYKVLTDRAIFVFPDTQPKHALYDDQVIQTFPISHADLAQLVQIITAVIRLQGVAGGVQPVIQPNVATNTLVVRTTVPMMQIVEAVIRQNDRPPAEIVVDVEILEVNRTRAKSYGLSLSEYAIGGMFSPEVAPNSGNVVTQPGGAAGQTPTNGSTPPSSIVSGPPFNLNTITRGFTTSDFYLAVPTAIVRFLESDSQTKLIAKPQLRGTEGQKLTLRLGESTPVPSTTFTPLAAGGATANPLTSFNYRDVGVNLDITPRVTLDGDIIMDLTVENSSIGRDVLVNGVTAPSFGQRTVTTRLRLRDGESNLLAGLLREDERKSLQGFPGVIHLPILKHLFSSNENSITQTDIVMLLTPHIVRSKGDYTADDLLPIYIGSGQNIGLNGPPSLIAAVDAPPPTPAAAPAAPPLPANAIPAPGGGFVAPPPGSSPIPGTIPIPTPTAPAPAPVMPPPPPVTSPSPSPITPQPITPQPVTPQPTPPPGAAGAGAADTPLTTTGMGAAQVTLTPPGTTFRVGGGPYTVPITVANATRLSTISLTVTFDPARLRVRSVQEGSFMRSGSVNTTFMQQVGNGRVDITITRASDATGASGTGLLSAILFDPIGAGTVPLNISGVASGPGGTVMSLQLRPVTVTIQQ